MFSLFSCNQLQKVVSLGLWPNRGTVSPLPGRRVLDKRAYYSIQERTSGAPDASMWYGGDMDLNVRAFRVVQAATSESTEIDKRKESARKGGLVGGPSRARSISAKRRTEIAKKASAARWSRRRSEA